MPAVRVPLFEFPVMRWKKGRRNGEEGKEMEKKEYIEGQEMGIEE